MSLNSILYTKFCFIAALTSMGNVRLCVRWRRLCSIILGWGIISSSCSSRMLVGLESKQFWELGPWHVLGTKKRPVKQMPTPGIITVFIVAGALGSNCGLAYSRSAQTVEQALCRWIVCEKSRREVRKWPSFCLRKCRRELFLSTGRCQYGRMTTIAAHNGEKSKVKRSEG